MNPLLVGWTVEGRRALVVGGGGVASRRVDALRLAGAQVRVVASAIDPVLRARADVAFEERPYADGDLEGVDLVLVCVDEATLGPRVADEARRRRLPVHVADVPDLCDFVFPAVHRDGPVQIAVSTAGMGPALAGRLRDRIAAALPDRLGHAVSAFGDLRARIRRADPSHEASRRRMKWLRAAGRALAWEELAELDAPAQVERYRAGLAARSRPRVQLVGAGPGRPDLLTVAARNALEQADLVLADRICSPQILALVRGDLRIARKFKGRGQKAQDELQTWMLEAALAGRRVVRLKAGDPFLFGRGLEEVRFLAEHGIEAEVVPGITSAFAGPAAAGIPVTTRGVADRVLVMTGHGTDGRQVEPPSFREDQTLVMLMAVSRLPELVERLQDLGWPPDWPAAAVMHATWATQRSVEAPIGELARAAEEACIQAPAVIVVGRVVDLARWSRAVAPLAQAG